MATKTAFPVRTLVRALMFLSVLVLALSGCASASTSTSTSGGIKSDKGISTLPDGTKLMNLGILTPLSGTVGALIGIPLTNGIDCYFQGVNDSGGIDGYKVNLLKHDTQYNAQVSLQQYNDIHDNILMVSESLGTAPTFAIKDAAVQDKMLVMAATLASSLARETNLVQTGTPYRLQVENAFDYVTKKLGISSPKTGIIYQNDNYGKDGLAGYTESVAFYHLNDVGQKSYNSGDTDFSAQVVAMKTAGADYVFLSTTPTETAKIIGTGAAIGYTPQWILQSPGWSNVLYALAPQLIPVFESHVWLMGQGAVWGDTSVPGMSKFLADQAKYFPNQKPDGFFAFGYILGEINYALLKKAADNKDITRQGLLNAYKGLSVNLGGLYPNITYGDTPDKRVPTRDNEIFVLDHTQPTGGKILVPDFTGGAALVSTF
jgi:ABC-type branched-subunit amino acid transport system substrate-binding protein